jgi:hypothetical protein
MIGFDDVNRAVGNFGTSLGNLGSEFGKAQAAQREGYKAKSIAALGQGNVADAIRYARLADPSSTVGDDFTHAFGTEAVAKPGAVNPAANLATTPTPGAPAPTMAPKPTGADETMTQRKDLGVDEKDRSNITKMAAYLGIQKPESKYSSVDGYGLLEITPGYAGLPAEAKTLLAERLGMKERAGLLLDKAKLDQTRQLTLAEINTRINLSNQDNATRRWIAGLGDGTERWKAALSARAKAAGMNDDTARSIAAIANAVRGQYPRRKDAMDRFTETDEEYEARVAPVMKAWLSESGINLPDVPNAAPPSKPAPAAPVTPPAPPAGGGWPGLPNLGDAFGGRPAPPGPSTPPAKLPPAPVAPSPQTTFAPIASRSVPGGKAAPVLNGMVEEYKSAFGAQAVTSTARNAADDAAKGRAYDSYHHHGKAFDATPALPSLQAAIQWGVERNARVLIEGDHIHYEPSQKGQGYVEVKKGSGGVYVDAYRALTSKPAAKPAPGKPASKPAPKGATPRIQQLLNSTNPRD